MHKYYKETIQKITSTNTQKHLKKNQKQQNENKDYK